MNIHQNYRSKKELTVNRLMAVYGNAKYQKNYNKATYGPNGKIKGSQDLEDLTSDKYQ